MKRRSEYLTVGRVANWFERPGRAFGFIDTADRGRVFLGQRSLGARNRLHAGDVVKVRVSTDRAGRQVGDLVDVLQSSAPAGEGGGVRFSAWPTTYGWGRREFSRVGGPADALQLRSGDR
ncbi:MAG: hypothetical protein AB7U83_23450 [Vicinamibacterales bacterium]